MNRRLLNIDSDARLGDRFDRIAYRHYLHENQSIEGNTP
jgi:hypothetical protein